MVEAFQEQKAKSSGCAEKEEEWAKEVECGESESVITEVTGGALGSMEMVEATPAA